MTSFVYSGSGPGAPENYLFIKTDGDEKAEPVSFDKIENFLFPTLGRDRKTVAAVCVKDKTAQIVIGNIKKSDGGCEIVKTVEGDAVYYPIVSPDGNRVAYITTPGRAYPPKRDDVGVIHVVEKSPQGWVDVNFETEAFLDPFDWGRNNDELLHPAGEGALYRTSIGAKFKQEELADNAFYPVTAPSGEAFAYYDGEKIVVVHSDGNTNNHKLDTDIRHLSWGLTDRHLHYVATSGFWRMEAVQIDSLHGETKRMFETSEISFMSQIGE